MKSRKGRRRPQKVLFTDTFLNGLPVPSKGSTSYWDSQVNYLCVRITALGTRSFMVYRYVWGKPTRLTIGRYPEVSVDAARRKALAINLDIARGNLRPILAGETFKDLFTIWLEQYAKPYLKTWKDSEGIYRRYLAPALDHCDIYKIKKVQVQMLHARIGSQVGKTSANHAVELLKAVYNKALEWELYQGANPAIGIRKYQLQPRERFLTEGEIGRFFEAVDKLKSEVARDFILLALFTGARKTNLLKMRWDQLDLTARTWRIPETKNGTSQLLPLTADAVSILERRRTTSGGDWVLPGDSPAGHFSRPQCAWTRVIKTAGIKDLRIHDARRSLGSWQAITGASLVVIGKSLNHKNPVSTSIYARLQLEPVRDAMQTAITAMRSAASANQESQPTK